MSLEEKVKWGQVWREYSGPVEFYNENYLGLTRGQLKKEDSSLYRRLRIDGLLEHVPLQILFL